MNDHRTAYARDRRPAGAWWRRVLCSAVLLLAVPLWAAPARALQLGGSLTWDLSHTETETAVGDSSQNRFGQGYQINGSGNILTRRLAYWTAGAGWRNDRTTFSGLAQPAREVSLTDFRFGLTLLPGTMPINLSIRRSITDTEGSPAAGNTLLSNTISLATRIPLTDGDPLGLSAYQSRQDTGQGQESTSRLVSLSKRFDLGRATHLNSSYQFSQFESAGSRSTGHGLSLASHTVHSERLSSNLSASVTSRDEAINRVAGGRTLFMSNRFGAGLSYKRGADMSAGLNYGYAESPQTQGSDIVNQMASGNVFVRASKKTDLRGRFTVRQLDLGTSKLNTVTTSGGYRFRPFFGWATGVNLSLSYNETTGASPSDRANYGVTTYLNARHDLKPAQISWGATVGYVSTTGSLEQDRLSTTLFLSGLERRLRSIRLGAGYRFTDIQQSTAGGGLSAFSQEHGITFTGTLSPIHALWHAQGRFTGGFSSGIRWNRRFGGERNVRNVDFRLHGRYAIGSGITTNASYDFKDNSSDLAGTNQMLRADVQWSRNALRRGRLRLKGDYRRNYQGGHFASEESGVELRFDYSVGLLKIAVSGDYSLVGLPTSASDTNTASIRLNIVRTF